MDSRDNTNLQNRYSFPRSRQSHDGRGHLPLKQTKTVRCANLTVETRRAPAGKRFSVVASS